MRAGFWRLGGLSWWRLAVRVYRQAMRDELIGRAAELAYFFLFAVFPLLLFLTTLFGYVAWGNWELRHELFTWVSTVAPSPEVTVLLQTTLDEVAQARGGGKLSLGLAAALWVASNGMLAVGRTLNTAWGLKESRPFWMRRALSVLLVTVFAVLILLGLLSLFFGGWFAERAAFALGLGAPFAWVWTVTQWGLVLLFVILAFDLIYNFAPNLARRHRVWITPGACVAVALWLLASWGMQVYLSNFGFYSRTYGSLGAVIVLLLWFYVTAIAILLGGEVNSEISLALHGEISREGRSRERRPRAS
jgi:membrane protein